MFSYGLVPSWAIWQYQYSPTNLMGNNIYKGNIFPWGAKAIEDTGLEGDAFESNLQLY